MTLQELGFDDMHIKALISTLESQSLWTTTGCLERQKTPNKDGYTNIHIGKKVYSAHRLIYILKKGGITPDHIIMHSCDNRRCINIDHLSEGTPRRNTHDCIAKKRTDWQQKPAPIVTIEPTQHRRYPLTTVFDAINRRLHGQEIADISKDMTIPHRQIEDWMRDMFGTINVGIMLETKAEFDPVVNLVTLYKPKVVPVAVKERKAKNMSMAEITTRMVEQRRIKRDTAITDLHDLGLHPLDIVESVGCSTSTVRGVLMRDRNMEYVSFKRGKAGREKSDKPVIERIGSNSVKLDPSVSISASVNTD